MMSLEIQKVLKGPHLKLWATEASCRGRTKIANSLVQKFQMTQTATRCLKGNHTSDNRVDLLQTAELRLAIQFEVHTSIVGAMSHAYEAGVAPGHEAVYSPAVHA